MKILIATGIYPPDIGGPAFYTERIARKVRGLGNEAVVISYGKETNQKDADLFLVRKTLPAGVRHLVYAWRVFRLGKDADIIYVQDSWSAGLPALFANIFLKKPFALKVVGDYAWEQAQASGWITDSLDDFQTKKYGLRIRFMRYVARIVPRYANCIITPSEYLKNIVWGWGVNKEAVRVIYNAVDLLKSGNGLRNRPPAVLSIGRLVPWKGFEELIFVMREVREAVPNTQLVIVGDGPDRGKLERFVLEQGLETVVHLPGKVAHDELPELYGTAAAFVLNTSYEGFSHQLVEVMGAGLPVATTPAGGNRELCRDGENSILFPVNDLSTMKEAIIRLLTDIPFAEKIRNQAKEDVKKFSEEGMVNETLALFKRITGEHGNAIVNISLDETILNPDSSSYRRMLAYAEGISAFTSVILGKGTHLPLKKLGTNLFGVRFGGASKISAFVRTLWKIKSLKFLPEKPTVISSQDPFFAGLIAWRLAMICKANLIIELHGDFWPEDRKLWPGFLRQQIAKRVLGRANVVRIVSNKVKEGLVRAFPLMKEKKTEIFPIVSGETSYVPSASSDWIVKKWPENSIRVLFVGRLVKEKGLDWFLPILANVPKNLDIHLLIIGEGPDAQDLKKQCDHLGISNKVTFVGAIPLSEMPGYYQAADFLVLSSRQESWGRVLIEAMKCGLPVLATREVGAAHDMLENNQNALIAPFGDSDAMKSALIRMATDKVLRERLGQAGRARVADLSFSQTVDKIHSLWKSV